jgi:hypothetical protein
MKAAIVLLSFSMLAAISQQAAAWGDDGHKTVALIAEHYLTPAARSTPFSLLTPTRSRSTTSRVRRHGSTGIATATTGRTTTTKPSAGTSLTWKSLTRT